MCDKFKLKQAAFKVALCVIFKIFVSFSRENALFASKAKINVFFNFLNGGEARGVKKNFKKH